MRTTLDILPILLLGTFATGFYFALRRFSIKRMMGGSALLVLLIVIGGCSQNQDDGPLRSSGFHDFGIIVDTKSPLPHTFKLSNPGNEAIEIASVSSTCGCFIASNALGEGTRIEPGDEIHVPVTINVASKLGDFTERLMIEFIDESYTPQLLSIRGFVQRFPIAIANPFTLSYAEDETSLKQDIAVKYTRPPSGKPADLRDFSIETEQSNGVAPLVGGKATSELLYSGPHSVTEVWRFPIKMSLNLADAPVEATLRIRWRHPKTETRVLLTPKPIPCVELYSRSVLLPITTIETSELHLIPIRINNSKTATSLKLVSDSPSISGRIDVDSRRLVLDVSPDRPGKFSYVMRGLVSGEERLSFEVTGFAKESAK